MRLLLDTHTLVWMLQEPAQLGSASRQALESTANDVFVSMATVWEIAILQSLGKIELDPPLQQIEEVLDIEWLPIDLRHAALVRVLPFHHRDPFDRMLVAQAIVEGMSLVTRDRKMAAYPVATLW